MSFPTNNQNNSNESNSFFGFNNNLKINQNKPLFSFSNDNPFQNINKNSNENQTQFSFLNTNEKNESIFKNSNDKTSYLPLFRNDNLNQDNSKNNINIFPEQKIEVKESKNIDFKNTNYIPINQNKIFTNIPESNNEISNQFNLTNNLNQVNILFNYLA
jgi:hypothetical protein